MPKLILDDPIPEIKKPKLILDEEVSPEEELPWWEKAWGTLEKISRPFVPIPKQPEEEPTWWEKAKETVVKGYEWLYPEGIVKGTLEAPKYWGKALEKVGLATGEGATWIARNLAPGQENLPPYEEQSPARQALTLAQGASVIALATIIGDFSIRALSSLAKSIAYGKVSRIADKVATEHFAKIKATNPEVKTLEDAKALLESSLKTITSPVIETTYLPTTMRELGKLGKQLLKPLPTQVPTAEFKAQLGKQVTDIVASLGKALTPEIIKPFTQMIEQAVGTPATGVITPEFGKSMVALLNKDIPMMFNELIAGEEVTAPLKPELIPEEKIVEEKMRKPLEKVSPYGEKFEEEKTKIREFGARIPSKELPTEKETVDAFIGTHRFKIDSDEYFKGWEEAHKSDDMVAEYAKLTNQEDQLRLGGIVKGLQDDPQLVKLSEQIYEAQGLTKEGKIPTIKPKTPNYLEVARLEREAQKIVQEKINAITIPEIPPEAKPTVPEVIPPTGIKEEKPEIPKEIVPTGIKPPVPPSPPPKELPQFGEEPIEDPIVKLNELLKQAKPLRGKLEATYTEERAKRFQEIDRFINEDIDNFSSEKTNAIILSKLKGELAPPEAKIAFEPVKEKLTEEQLKALYDRNWKHPYLDMGEKLSAYAGLTDLLMGGIPQPKQLTLLEEIYGTELIKNILSKRVWGAKATDFLVELANVPRAALATADMSAFLRQGVIEIAAHPVISVKAMAKTFEFAFKPETFEQYFKDLPEHRHYPLIRKFKVEITDPSKAGMVEREEAFISRFLQKIPIIKIPVMFAERAYVGFLNKLRVDIFSLWADELLSKGFTSTKNPEHFRAAADVINTFTARGSLGKLDRITPQLNIGFFSPRLIAARFQALNPVWYAKQPKEIRKKAIGDIAKFVTAGLTVLALVKIYKEATGASDDEISVETDTRSSDSGKIRIGNTRFDIWGGFQQWVRVFTQIALGERKSTVTDEIISLNKDEYPFTTRKEVLLRFIEGKLAPIPALVNELMSGAKTFEGEDMSLQSVAVEKFIPMYIQDIAEAYADGGLEMAIGAGIPAFFGVGVQTWGPRKKKEKTWYEFTPKKGKVWYE